MVLTELGGVVPFFAKLLTKETFASMGPAADMLSSIQVLDDFRSVVRSDSK